MEGRIERSAGRQSARGAIVQARHDGDGAADLIQHAATGEVVSFTADRCNTPSQTNLMTFGKPM